MSGTIPCYQLMSEKDHEDIILISIMDMMFQHLEVKNKSDKKRIYRLGIAHEMLMNLEKVYEGHTPEILTNKADYLNQNINYILQNMSSTMDIEVVTMECSKCKKTVFTLLNDEYYRCMNCGKQELINAVEPMQLPARAERESLALKAHKENYNNKDKTQEITDMEKATTTVSTPAACLWTELIDEKQTAEKQVFAEKVLAETLALQTEQDEVKAKFLERIASCTTAKEKITLAAQLI